MLEIDRVGDQTIREKVDNDDGDQHYEEYADNRPNRRLGSQQANGNDRQGGEEWDKVEKKEDIKTYKKRRGLKTREEKHAGSELEEKKKEINQR